MRSLSLRLLLPKLSVTLFVAVLALVIPSDIAPVLSSGNFSPTASLTLTDHTPGASPDSTSSFDIAAGQLLGAPVALTPQAATINPSPGTIATGLGDVVGTLTADSTVGINNGPCNFPVAVTATLLSATVDNSAGNLIYPSNPHESGPQGPLSPLRQDTYVVTPDNIAGNGNDVVGAAAAGSAPSAPANGLPSHADRYPAFLNTVFDPDGTGPSPALTPLARYSGSTVVLGSTIVLIQAVVFSPGALAAYAPPATLSDLGAVDLGYASIVVLNDPTAAPVPGNLITDLCSHLGATSTVYGITKANPCAGNTLPPCNTDDGINSPVAGVATARVRYANPATAGTYVWYGFHTSARDLDSDGIENSLDTCPYNANLDGDPRTTSGADGDMIDTACDPDPAVNEGSGDFDGDGFKNAADNCPLVPNPTQAQAESSEPDNVASPRGGSGTDSLGDECDGAETACGANVDDDADGLVNDGCPTVGGAAAESSAQCGFSTSAPADNDFDGYPNDGCVQVGATAESGADCGDFANDDSADDTFVNDGCPAQGGPELGCLNTVDDDVDGWFNDGCPSSSRVGTGHYHTVLTVGPKCIGGIDNDNDGWCGSGHPGGQPIDQFDSNASRIPETYSQLHPFPVAHSGSGSNPPASREPIQVCNDGIDNDGDTLIDLFDGTGGATSITDDCKPPDAITTSGPDTDGDGRRDAVEIHLGTDPLSRCERGLAVNGTTPSKGWALDLRGESAFSGDKVNVSDIGTFISGIKKNGTSPGDAGFDRRWDLRPGNAPVGKWIGVADIAALTSANPIPMYEVRPFGFLSVCSAHPVYGD